MRPLPASSRGFTLIEVVISLVVFSVLVLIFAASIPLAHMAADQNGQYAQATSLCQHKIDQLRAMGYGRMNYTELLEAGRIDDSYTSSPYHFTVVDDLETYLPGSEGTLAIDDVGLDVKKITITVSWKTALHRPKTSTMSLSALIANAE